MRSELRGPLNDESEETKGMKAVRKVVESPLVGERIKAVTLATGDRGSVRGRSIKLDLPRSSSTPVSSRESKMWSPWILKGE